MICFILEKCKPLVKCFELEDSSLLKDRTFSYHSTKNASELFLRLYFSDEYLNCIIPVEILCTKRLPKNAKLIAFE